MTHTAATYTVTPENTPGIGHVSMERHMSIKLAQDERMIEEMLHEFRACTSVLNDAGVPQDRSVSERVKMLAVCGPLVTMPSIGE